MVGKAVVEREGVGRAVVEWGVEAEAVAGKGFLVWRKRGAEGRAVAERQEGEVAAGAEKISSSEKGKEASVCGVVEERVWEALAGMQWGGGARGEAGWADGVAGHH